MKLKHLKTINELYSDTYLSATEKSLLRGDIQTRVEKFGHAFFKELLKSAKYTDFNFIIEDGSIDREYITVSFTHKEYNFIVGTLYIETNKSTHYVYGVDVSQNKYIHYGTDNDLLFRNINDKLHNIFQSNLDKIEQSL